MRVAVCALTYLRPTGLRRLIDELDRLDPITSASVEVIVVDNDPDGSAEDPIRRLAAGRGFTICYVHEPARGISTARNTAVNTARRRGADAICFIDDDEWPDPAWLNELLRTQAETDADVVTGPVVPVFDEPPPRWVTIGGFFERPRHGHNEQIGYATTSNVLIMTACIADRHEPFDPAFGLSGGEDTHLFAQLREAGKRIVWCDRATVFEAIPTSRVDARWLVRREYRRGQTLSLSLRARDPRFVRVVSRLGNAALQFVVGSAHALIGLARGRAYWLAGVRQIALGGGMITGLAGRRFQEYETIHGT